MPVLAVLAIVLGGILIGRALSVELRGEFAAVAYAPLSDTTFTPGVGGTGVAPGIALVMLGVGALALLFGRRRPARLAGVLPWLAGGAIAVAVGGVLLALTRPDVFLLLPQRGQIVGVALLLAGIAALGFGVGRLIAGRRSADTTKRPPHTA